MAGGEVRERLAADGQLAAGHGAKANPLVLLDGRPLKHWLKPETWDLLIGESAERSAASHPGAGG